MSKPKTSPQKKNLTEHHYLLTLSGELLLKSRPVRWQFLNQLHRNLKKTLEWFQKQDGFSFSLHRFHDHFQVYCSKPIEPILTKIAGIQKVIKVHSYPANDSLETCLEAAKEFFLPHVQGKTFAVRARVQKKGIQRKIERSLGDLLYPFSAGVNLTQPEVTCHVYARQEGFYFYTDTMVFEGMGGFPVNSEGKALLLFSGGLDSPIAALKLYQVGIGLYFVYFDLGNPEQWQCVLETARYVRQHWGHGAPDVLIKIPFVEVVEQLRKLPAPYQNLALKVVFYQCAEQLAKELKADALATGEAIGQVSTQTLRNLTVLDRFTTFFVLRPLLATPKQQIIDEAHRWGLYEKAYKGKEFCALATKKVKTQARYENLSALMENFPKEVLQHAIEQKSIYHLLKPIEAKEEQTTLEGTIIFIGEEEEIPSALKQVPLPLKRYLFNEAWSDCLHWNKEAFYWLLCPTGGQSALLARLMEENGFRVKPMSVQGFLKHLGHKET